MNFYRQLENLYLKAPINHLFCPEITVTYKKAEINMAVKPDFYHGANALHGSVYFKMLDDAAFFAAQSVVEDFFILTADFNIKFLKPVKEGVLKATGMLLEHDQKRFFAKAYLYNDGVLVAKGDGSFAKSTISIRSLF